MAKTLGELIKRRNSSSIETGPNGETIFLAANQTVGGENLKINENFYELTAEIQKALSSSGYTGKSMKNDSNFLIFGKTIKNLGYTGKEDEFSKRKTFILNELPRKVAKTEDEIDDKSDDLQGKWTKITIPSNIIDIWNRLEI